MARIHGRSGRLYVDISGTGSAEPIAFLSKWGIKFVTDKKEATAFGDANKVYVAGLPDAQGTYSGFYDDATQQLYTASQDGVARKFYIYPSITTTHYWYGTALFDFSIDGDVANTVNISGTWAAASAIAKVG